MIGRVGPVAALLTSTLLAAGCGGGGPSEGASATTGPAGPDTVVISPVDTIGVLMGDSNYVFGTIGEAVYTPGGDIAVLDEVDACVKVYSPEGEFLMRVGRSGSGPGEVRHPGGLAMLSDSSFALMDTQTGGVHRFHPDGSFDTLHIDFMGDGSPQWAWGVDSCAFVAAYLDDEMTGGMLEMVYRVGRWETEREPEVVYHEHRFPFDHADMAGFITQSVFSVAFAAGRDGTVFVAPVSSEEYRIDVFDREGTSTGTITRELPRVAKSEEEIEEEEALMEAILRERGIPDYMNRFEADPWRWMVTPQGLGVDGEGRLWVRNGTVDGIVMDVYSPDGEHLAVVAVEGVTDPDTYDYTLLKVQPQGILAYSLQSPDYPKLFVLPMPDLPAP